MNKVAILLVLYNDAHYLPGLVKSIKQQTYQNVDVYAIETSRTGESITKLIELYPKAKTFPYQGNLGFAAGNNFLARRAYEDGADYLFVLNTDMELSSNTLEVFLSYFKKDQKIGVVSSTLMKGDTNILQLFGAKANFKTQKKEFIYPNKNINEINLPEELEVDYVNGGSAFLSRKVYEMVGLFNEDFFMYNDEIEIAYKTRKAGFKTIVTSKTLIKHHHNWVSEKKGTHSLMSYYRMRNRYLYFLNKKLIGYLLIDLLTELFLLPFTLFLAHNKNKVAEIKFHYLGLLHGLQGKKGKSSINFDNYD